jgi:hypothetical protein
MNNISDLLSKFTFLDNNRKQKKQLVKVCLDKIFSLKLDDKDISFSGDKVVLKVGSLYKTEIFVRKNEFTSCVNETLPEKEKIKDIR